MMCLNLNGTVPQVPSRPTCYVDYGGAFGSLTTDAGSICSQGTQALFLYAIRWLPRPRSCSLWFLPSTITRNIRINQTRIAGIRPMPEATQVDNTGLVGSKVGHSAQTSKFFFMFFFR